MFVTTGWPRAHLLANCVLSCGCIDRTHPRGQFDVAEVDESVVGVAGRQAPRQAPSGSIASSRRLQRVGVDRIVPPIRRLRAGGKISALTTALAKVEEHSEKFGSRDGTRPSGVSGARNSMRTEQFGADVTMIRPSNGREPDASEASLPTPVHQP